jgi:3-phenylpropionate/cinnamic acid dioxygenase small subunit
MAGVQEVVERLLYTEARLLDRTEYEAWLELLSPRIRYWAPVRRNLAVEALDDPALLSLFDDRKADLALRIKRMRTGYALSEQPASRARRLVTNVIVDQVAEDGTGAHVSSSFLVTVSRWDQPARLYSGARRDRWSRGASGWLLEERRILFDLATTQNVSFLV